MKDSTKKETIIKVLNTKINLNYKKIFQYLLFFIFVVINFYLTICHETWRDEIHAWTMAKYLSINDLFTVSKFDGHPILWHLILMPFAKLNFPVITLQIISFVIITIAAYLFVFHSKLNNVIKFIILFTVPFIYIYSANARNYCLIVLLLVVIGLFYKKRYEKPIFYSILICLLIHTHSLSWGLVAGLIISFHLVEIVKYILHKNQDIKIKQITLGFILIVLNTLLVMFELFGTGNPDYVLVLYETTKKVIALSLLSSVIFIVLTFTLSKKNLKELFIVICGILFQCIIYIFFYGAITEQRYLLPTVLWLFFLLLLQSTDISKKSLTFISTAFIIFNLVCGYINYNYSIIKADVLYSYSGCSDMADYINQNLYDEDTILVDSSIICQSIVPYLNNAHLYDLYYNEYFENIKYMSSNNLDIKNLDFSNYKNKYLIISSNIQLEYPIIYQTAPSISGENFTLYYLENN